MAAAKPAEVLIVGAGPTGLVLALWLTRLGVQVRIVDHGAAPATTSRAVAVQARTLEFYRQVGLADSVIARGREVSAANLWVSGRWIARAVFGPMCRGISPYPDAFIFPQDEHERLLIDRLSDAGVGVDRETEFVGLEERDDGIIARLQRAGGRVDFCEAAFVARLRRRSLASPRGAVDRFCGWDVPASLLRRRCRGARTGDEATSTSRSTALTSSPCSR
jgi:2-polyprenyl-6-methoxyphenol hydroxylase-like FAD-dependent oxidoreductase